MIKISNVNKTFRKKESFRKLKLQYSDKFNLWIDRSKWGGKINTFKNNKRCF